ncbi:MAG: hypothetical protein ACJZ72_12845 [Opitutales bacterium]
MGPLQHPSLRLQGGGVYDWELQDFDGTTGGTDYDVMNFHGSVILVPSSRSGLRLIFWVSNQAMARRVHLIIWLGYGGSHRQGAGSGSTNGFKFLRLVMAEVVPGGTWTGRYTMDECRA